MKTNFQFFGKYTLKRGTAWGMMIVAALLAFEIFNFSSTAFALEDMLGNLRFLGVRWATILAIAFCGIDFAGVARLFTPEQGAEEPAEVWYLFGAWILAAAMNAILTWWGVSVAILQSGHLGSAVVSAEIMTKGIPVFVAVMVWLIRVLIIGTFSVAGERLFSQAPKKSVYSPKKKSAPRPAYRQPVRSTFSPRPAAASLRSKPTFNAEPTYHNLASASSHPQSFTAQPVREQHKF